MSYARWGIQERQKPEWDERSLRALRGVLALVTA